MKTRFHGDPDDIYYAQRQELQELLTSCAKKHAPLVALDRILLKPDEIYTVLHKINQRNHFSDKERRALSEAGFNLGLLFPEL